MQEAPSLKHRENWGILRRNHKRLVTQTLSLQELSRHYIRFVLTGDICGARPTFGRLSPQLNRLGIVQNLAIAERDGIALAHSGELPSLPPTLSRKRRNEDTPTNGLLGNEHEGAKKSALREHGAIPSAEQPRQRPHQQPSVRKEFRPTIRPPPSAAEMAKTAGPTTTAAVETSADTASAPTMGVMATDEADLRGQGKRIAGHISRGRPGGSFWGKVKPIASGRRE